MIAVSDKRYKQIEKIIFVNKKSLKHELTVLGLSHMTNFGTYKILPDSQILYVSFDQQEPSKFNIKKLNADTLELFAVETNTISAYIRCR